MGGSLAKAIRKYGFSETEPRGKIYALDKNLSSIEDAILEKTIDEGFSESETAKMLSPDVVLCIGQAGGRNAITPELVAINLRHANIPDNKGNQPLDETIVEGGKTAYFSTLPVRKMAVAIHNSGIPSQVSYSAGAYVCNDVIYTLLAHFDGTKTRAGFIHIPYCTEQNKTPSMPLEEVVKGLIVAIETLAE